MTRVLFLLTLGSNGPHGCVRKARDSQNPYKTCPIWTTLTREAKKFCYLGRTAPCTRIEAEKFKKSQKNIFGSFLYHRKALSETNAIMEVTFRVFCLVFRTMPSKAGLLFCFPGAPDAFFGITCSYGGVSGRTRHHRKDDSETVVLYGELFSRFFFHFSHQAVEFRG